MTRYLFITEAALTEGEKLASGAIPSLLELQALGFRAVALSVSSELKELLESQDVVLELATPEPDRLSALLPFLMRPDFDRLGSVLIGDEPLAARIGISSLVGDWREVARRLKARPRRALSSRTTKETQIEVEVNLDGDGRSQIQTGLGFFDHMLEQLAKHGGMDLRIQVRGDLQIDEHHTVEDTAICLGEALRRALSDKVGIGRYGYVLPMDEAEARVSLDLSGRAYFVFKGELKRERVGELPLELVPHFFRSLSDSLGLTLHIEVTGENAHHMVESTFKAVGRSLRQAFVLGQGGLPSTKGVL